MDHNVSDEFRVVQMTPPGSACSITIGRGITDAVPGSYRGTHLVVDDIVAARDELVGRGVEVSDIRHFDGAGGSRAPTPRTRYNSFADFADPDGNTWVLQEARRGGRPHDRAGAALLGDEAGFATLAKRHRRELHIHCYRMLASFDEAEDAVQETMLRAWREGELRRRLVGPGPPAVAIASEDIRVTMPPALYLFEGLTMVAALIERAFAEDTRDGDWRLVPTMANRMPTAASYLRRPGEAEFRAFKLDVLRIDGGVIAEITTFGHAHFADFGLPPTL